MAKKKAILKEIISKLHLWLGMASGLVVFIIAVTGCIYVFSEEISHFLYEEQREVDVPSGQNKLPVSTLLEKASKVIDDQIPCQMILIPTSAENTISFIFQKVNEEAYFYPDYMEFYKTVYVNPYTGKIVEVEDTKWEFFNVVFWIHISLFFGYDTLGGIIITWSTWIFIFMLISGLVLWWPKLKNVKQSVKFKWKATTGWKRKNYDLHSILGFYVLLFALLSAFTGLFWASKSFNTSVKWLFNGGKTPVETNFPVAETNSAYTGIPIDDSFNKSMALTPEAKYILIRIPPSEKAPYVIRAYISEDLNYNRVVHYFDKTSAQLIQTETFEEKNTGDKVEALNYDIHVGSIGGMPTKILAFITSLIIASLPVTGFLYWLGRKKKKHT